jgi:Mg2+-importing ATPase
MSRKFSWFVGLCILIAVIMVALRAADAAEFIHLAESSQPEWLLAAVALQLLTYLAQGQVWREPVLASGSGLTRRAAYALSLVKLLIDQAVPTAGLSGTTAFATALERRGIERSTVMAAVVLNIVSYHLTYVAAVLLALVVAVVHRDATPVIVAAALFSFLLSATVSTVVIRLSRRTDAWLSNILSRVRPLRPLLEALAQTDRALVWNRRRVISACLCQLAIILLDAATLYVLIRALGVAASPVGVYASFMIANVFRTVGIVPGGLGTFEAASVLTLRMAGASVSAALSATLLFRGLSFWLPLLPGFLLSRRTVSARDYRPSGTSSPDNYWSATTEEMLTRLHTSVNGLSSAQALDRLREVGVNSVVDARSRSHLRLFIDQFRSPLLLLLLLATIIAGSAGAWLDSLIVLTVLLVSTTVGFIREARAQEMADALRDRVRSTVRVLRDGTQQLLPVEDLVPGDIVTLSAGRIVPADCMIIEATDLMINQSAFTGESFPVRKTAGPAAPASGLSGRTNCVFRGSDVRSGGATCVVVRTGGDTELGRIAQRITRRPAPTEFERGTRQFGVLLTVSALLIVIVVFVFHMFAGRPPATTLLFAIALAVGLAPELLPAVMTFSLASGARAMASRGVLVRQLSAIENLGSIDVLCTDKTGTLTEGVVRLESALDSRGARSDEVLRLAALNAALDTGLDNPLDDAIASQTTPDTSAVQKIAEIPFDFIRKRVCIVIRERDEIRMIVKGAFQQVLDACNTLDSGAALDSHGRAALQNLFNGWSESGIRVLAVADKVLAPQAAYSREDETDLTFRGFLTFADSPKPGVAQAIAGLREKGVQLKLVTGDNKNVAVHLAAEVGLRHEHVLTGHELNNLQNPALRQLAAQTDLFVEVDPIQKERVILALKEAGHVVGFLGDGVNDAAAMHAADASISVQSAVDVAREAASFVLLERSLDVILRGIDEGRRTFANTLKYIFTTMSANIGNMISMAIASVFLPFLPLLPGQILLNNLLSDIPAAGLASDNVDADLTAKPRRWQIRSIGKFTLQFGLLSSAFDFVTFFLLLRFFHAGPVIFRTAWFVESLLTELAVALVMRSRHTLLRSNPGKLLLWSSVALSIVAVTIPIVPGAGALGFQPLPVPILITICGVVMLYILAAEAMKKRHFPV